MKSDSFLPYLLPYLGESGWFSVGLGARKPLNTNDFGIRVLRGGGSEKRKVDGSIPGDVPSGGGFSALIVG